MRVSEISRALVFAIVVLLASGRAAHARCGGAEVRFSPKGPIGPWGPIVAEYSGMGGPGLDEIRDGDLWLETELEGTRVPLRVEGRKLDSPLPQVVLVPEVALTPGTTYVLGGLWRAGHKLGGPWLFRVAAAKGLDRDPWQAPPSVLRSHRHDLGCGPQISVEISLPLEWKAFLWVEAAIRERSSHTGAITHRFPVEGGALSLGRHMCGGPFDFMPGVLYSAEIVALDARGRRWPAPGGPLRFLGPEPTPSRGRRREALERELEPPPSGPSEASIIATLRDRRGTPLRDIYELVLRRIEPGPAEEPSWIRRWHPWMEARGLDPGLWEFRAGALHFSALQRVRLTAGSTVAIDLTLRAGTVEGIIRDRQDRPLAGWRPRALDSPHSDISAFNAVTHLTKEDGVFWLEGIGSRPAWLEAVCHDQYGLFGEAVGPIARAERGAEQVLLRGTAPGRLRIELDAADAFLPPWLEATFHPEKTKGTQQASSRRSRSISAGGSAPVPIRQRAVEVSTCGPVRGALEWVVPGFLPTRAVVDVPEGGMQTVRARLEPAPTLQGQVVDAATGRPLLGAEVSWVYGESGAPFGRSMVFTRTVSDLQGRFALVPSEETTGLRVEAPGYDPSVLSLASPGALITLKLRPLTP